MLSIVVAEIQSCHLIRWLAPSIELSFEKASCSLFAWVHDLIFER